jgi:hypothetical protein
MRAHSSQERDLKPQWLDVTVNGGREAGEVGPVRLEHRVVVRPPLLAISVELIRAGLVAPESSHKRLRSVSHRMPAGDQLLPREHDGWMGDRPESQHSLDASGFELAPERFARLERALDAVRADMRATKVTGEVRLVRPDWNPGNVAVESWTGDRGWTAGVSSSQAADDARRRRIGHRRTTSLSAPPRPRSFSGSPGG